jgi:hypothetical protein
MGIPIMIQDEDCDVEQPCIDDMEKEMTLEAKHSFLQLVKLMQEGKDIIPSCPPHISSPIANSSCSKVNTQNGIWPCKHTLWSRSQGNLQTRSHICM